MVSSKKLGVCLICHIDSELTKHHLVPKQVSGTHDASNIALVCLLCHRQIHALFSNKQLKKDLNSIAKLSKHPQIKKWVKWRRRHREYNDKKLQN